MVFKSSIIATLLGAGITATSPEADVKKAYFGAAGAPVSKAALPDLIAALGGDQTKVIADENVSTGTKTAKAKTPKEPKAPAAPREVKPAETADAALARLKADPATSARWAKVRSVDEMGKRGPVKVTIVCEDKGPAGEELTRQIKVQDLFQVRFSAGYAKKNTRKSKKVAAAPATDASTPTA